MLIFGDHAAILLNVIKNYIYFSYHLDRLFRPTPYQDIRRGLMLNLYYIVITQSFDDETNC